MKNKNQSLRKFVRNIDIMLPCLLLFISLGSMAQDKRADAFSDKGVLITTLGIDTTFIHQFNIQGRKFESKVISRIGELTLIEGTGEFDEKGNIYQIDSRQFALQSDVIWKQNQQISIFSTHDSTKIKITRDGKDMYRNYKGRFLLTNSSDAISFQLFPFYGVKAPQKIGDSLIYKHVNPIGYRDFVIKRTAKNEVLVKSSFMGAIKLFLDNNDRLQSIDGIGSSLNFTSKVYRNASFETIKDNQIRQHLAGNKPVKLSLRDTARYRNDNQEILITYWAPSARGRKIFGGIVPYDKFWRIGANHATEMHIKEPIFINGSELKAGKYTMFARPSEGTWELCINGKTGIWGTEYNLDYDLLRAPLAVEQLDTHVEQLRISIDDTREALLLKIEWEKTRLSIRLDQ